METEIIFIMLWAINTILIWIYGYIKCYENAFLVGLVWPVFTVSILCFIPLLLIMLLFDVYSKKIQSKLDKQ